MKPATSASSPSKGKAKEVTHWHSGWWDFYPLLERPYRPLQWSQSSIIFSAHPSQPLVIARHFSSSKQFSLPSPKPVSTNQVAYEPPTIISIAPTDDWLFAYFPKTTGEGTGCLWKRGSQIDSWAVQEWWTFPPQTAPVTAEWLGVPREWIIDSSGMPSRLPPKGTALPTSSPTLILVTQDYRVHVCYYQYYLPNLQILKCALGAINVFRHNAVPSDDDPPDLVKICLDATIGLSYNADYPFFVAARVRRFTSSATQHTPFDPMDLTVPVVTQNEDQRQDEWDSRNDECIVEINQVFLRYDSVVMVILTQPLTPIPIQNTGLLKMNFLSCPIYPPPPDTAGTASPTKKAMMEKGKLYLVLTYLDFEGYVSTPKSQLSVYSVNRTSSISGKKVTFTSQLEATRTFAPSILTYIATHVTHLRENILPVALVDTSGQWSNISSEKLKEIVTGKVHMLTLPDLKDKEDWEPSVIKTPLIHAGRNLPLQGIHSPNAVILYTTSLCSIQPMTGTHLLPLPQNQSVPPLVYPLVLAILSRRSPSDVCHCLSLPSISLGDVITVLSGAMTVLDLNCNGVKYGWTWDMLGIAVEVYRKRGALSKDPEMKEKLTTKWQTAHDMCSIAACNLVFENCADGDMYDLDSVWQLNGLSSWITTLLEKIMKECVLFCDVPEQDGAKADEFHDDLFGPASGSEDANPGWEISPILLHLVHPFALQNLTTALKHVKKYHQYVKSMPARVEQSQIAKDVLVDMIDYSGLNLERLEEILNKSIEGVEGLQPDDCRKALASVQPTEALRAHLSNTVKQIAETPNVLDKATLFIKAEDLVDAIVNLNVGAGTGRLQQKQREEDTVTKGTLTKQDPYLTCSRCGGSSNVVFNLQQQSHQFFSDRWRIWEKMWTLRCVCGGLWTGAGST